MKRIRMLVALAATLLTLLTAVPASIASGLNNFYIIPDSDSRLLTEDELWDWQYEALGYIYNEIFARHPLKAAESMTSTSAVRLGTGLIPITATACSTASNAITSSWRIR